MNDMIRVLGRATSGNVQKVIFLLEELGLAYVREDYGRQFNNTNTDEYRKLNPNMKVPTLVDGDTVSWESNTILRYLSALHAPQLAGATPAEKTQVERWMDWMLAALNTPYVAVFKDAKKPAAERSADFEAQKNDLITQLKILEGHIAGKPWFALGRMTLADIALAPVVKRCLEFPIDRPGMSELERWIKAIEARPAFAVATGAKPSAIATAAA
jgi:glutathione S-transferase